MSAQRSQQIQETKEYSLYDHLNIQQDGHIEGNQSNSFEPQNLKKSSQISADFKNYQHQLKQDSKEQFKKQEQRIRKSHHYSSSSSKEGNESSTNNIEKQEGDEEMISDQASSQGNSTPNQKIIDYSSSQIEKIDSIQSTFSRQISEQQSQQFKMPSDYEESQQATPISQTVSNSQINKVMMMEEGEEQEEFVMNFKDQKNNKNLFIDYSKMNFLGNLNSHDDTRNKVEQQYSLADNQEYMEREQTQILSQIKNLNHFLQTKDSKQIQNEEQVSKMSDSDDSQNSFDEQDIDQDIEDYSDEEDSDEQHQYFKTREDLKDYQVLEKLQEKLNSAKQNSNINKDTNFQEQFKLLSACQNREDLNTNIKNANNFIEFNELISQKENQPNQQKQEHLLSKDQNMCIVGNKAVDSSLLNGQISNQQNNDLSSTSLSFLQESEKRQKKIDLLLRMQQFNGELKNDFEQAQNELLKLKTQKSLKLQDSNDSHSMRDLQDRQNRYEDSSNTKQTYNKYFETSNSIQTPAFIIENNSESKQSNSNGGISTQSNTSFAQLKSSEVGSIYFEQNFVKQEIKNNNQVNSQNNFSQEKAIQMKIQNESNEINENDDQEIVQTQTKVNQKLIQGNNQKNEQNCSNFDQQYQQDQNVTQIQKQKQKQSLTENKVQNSIQDHMDQLQALEQEKLKIQKLILEKQKKLMINSENQQHAEIQTKSSITTLNSPSKNISQFSTNSEQTQQNSMPSSTNQQSNQQSFILSQQDVFYQTFNGPAQLQNGINGHNQMQFQNQQQLIPQQLIQVVQQNYQQPVEKISSCQRQKDQDFKKKATSRSKNPQKKSQSQKSAKKTNQDQSNIKSEATSNNTSSKKLISRNVSNPKIQSSQQKCETVAAEGVEMKKQLEEKFQMQLEEIHYKNHIKVQKIMEKVKKLEDENKSLKHELQIRSLAAKELKESEARVANLAQSIQDIQIGKLIQDELEVRSMQEAYLKLKNEFKNYKQEKKFINCIVDMVNSCNPPSNQKSQKQGTHQNISSSIEQQSQQQQNGDQSNLKQAWKWLKFIIEDYVNLKSKIGFQNNNLPYGNKLDKNSQMYKSCVVENQSLNKQNQIDQVSQSLPLTSDTVVLQEINTYLKAENKYESLKQIKEIVSQNELLRQQVTYYQKKGADTSISSSVSSSSNISQNNTTSKRIQTVGSGSLPYNITRESGIHSPTSSQPLFIQHSQQQQRLLSPSSQQKQNIQQSLKQNTQFAPSQVQKNNTQQKQVFSQANQISTNNNASSLISNQSDGINTKQQLLRKLSPKKVNNTNIQSENDFNSLNYNSNSIAGSQGNGLNINFNQAYLKQSVPSNQKILNNQTSQNTACTSPQRQYTQGSIKSSQNNERLSTLHQSPRDNQNRNYNTNNSQNPNQLMSSPSSSSSYSRIKGGGQCYSTNPYLQVVEKQQSMQF
ncbi:hypothetical protein TTHERM_00051800 (macronuclear) [Tetrahymena thermophila SB210]|uniref:Uncharacterized protein n=1 Tax=Tetrahymena thermophila (strain SB210) TaxID=312017 RepID=Q23D09_TETTS|nr:hypothetical protein TTHERM_00051800 [Tetrahymena thermophila SB210]EAR94509.2 hypothetical protein TTHERM_00051800 [Tetrahymena thermophila SB210]|eukprot:XP_001014877.2 hypothetical protein TTHERM_00051800 [Tetrahymena thermophila SB210]